MANRQLTSDELSELFRPFIREVRVGLLKLSNGDETLHWALRRKLAKELVYDERGKPMQRQQLKAFKRGEQGNRCAICSIELPEKNVVLDRIIAMSGYTKDNTRLLCRECDYKQQESRGFA